MIDIEKIVKDYFQANNYIKYALVSLARHVLDHDKMDRQQSTENEATPPTVKKTCCLMKNGEVQTAPVEVLDPVSELLVKWHVEGLYPQIRRARKNEGMGAWKCYFFLGVAGNGRLIEGYGDTPLRAVEAAREDKDNGIPGTDREPGEQP
jgi:hypothetical protein